jgi:hypothetical protein
LAGKRLPDPTSGKEPEPKGVSLLHRCKLLCPKALHRIDQRRTHRSPTHRQPGNAYRDKDSGEKDVLLDQKDHQAAGQADTFEYYSFNAIPLP